MIITILDRLSDSVPGIKKTLQKEKEFFKKALESQYNFNALTFIKITREEAIKINLGDIKTINKVYFDNIRLFKNFAGYFQFNKTTGAKVYCVEDILQQVYVDLRYYDFTSDSTARKCLNITCKSSNNGGILNHIKYRNERKASCFLYEQINAHNSKMEDGALLLDIVEAPEKETNPEAILIDRETPKQYTEAMHEEIIKNLPRAQRYKYIEMFGVEND